MLGTEEEELVVTLRRREASVTGFGGGDTDVCALTLRLVELMEVLPWWGRQWWWHHGGCFTIPS